VQDDVPGLEVRAPDGSWQLVAPIPGALTINVGDLCQVLSNDRFKAPLHRVRASRGRRRYSAPFFFNPRSDADIAPLPKVGWGLGGDGEGLLHRVMFSRGAGHPAAGHGFSHHCASACTAALAVCGRAAPPFLSPHQLGRVPRQEIRR
jgi:hypothetical protein